ncbi:MAG: lytic transglycosylase domain-containing protein [Aquificota bacterium]|nr:MAG: lytic transglycosylase domain-containing protein [Aquificota bacterium]
MKEEIIKIVKENLKDRENFTPVILGIINTESSFNPLACRFEPEWKYLKTPSYFAKKLGITADTEIVFQKISWGLMQVMGSVYRELGYTGHLNALSTDIERQIRYGINHFFRFYSYYKDLYKAILGYNRGYAVKEEDVKLALLDEHSYLSKVLKHSKEFLEV